MKLVFVLVFLTSWEFQRVSGENNTLCLNCTCCDVGKDSCLLQEKTCTTCVDGYWGGVCRNKCPHACLACEKEPVYSGKGTYVEPIRYHVCTRCVDGRYLGNTVQEKTCGLYCPNRCTACESLESCSKCKTGLHGLVCTQKCPENCKDHVCTKTDGNCIECTNNYFGKQCNQCKAGFYSENCSLACLSAHCFENACNQELGMCERCAHGWFGMFCNESCSVGCKFGICSRDDGICYDGCLNTYSGDKCCVQNLNCLECSSTTNCTTCVDRYYGLDCELHCSDRCKDGCFKSSGECKDCKDGKFGNYCNNTCPDTCASTQEHAPCGQAAGECVEGCTKGYYGITCQKKCNKTCADGACDHVLGSCIKDEQMFTEDEIVKITALAVAATLILTVLMMTGILYLLWRIRGKRMKSPCAERTNDVPTENRQAAPYEILNTMEMTESNIDGVTTGNRDSTYMNECVFQ